MDRQPDLPLSGPLAPSVVVVNGRCVLRKEAEHRVVVVAGLPVHHYGADDEVAEAYAMVFLVEGGYATQEEVAAAFGVCTRTVRRHVTRYQKGGMMALAPRAGWRAGRRRLPATRLRVIERMKSAGLSNREIAGRLAVTENSIRKLVGPSERPPRQPFLPGSGGQDGPPPPSPPAGPEGGAPSTSETAPLAISGGTRSHGVRGDEDSGLAPMSLDADPTNRFWDRLLACFGVLDDAAPVFGDATAVPGAGVLCAVPLLVASDIFRVVGSVYQEIGPAFYGLRTTILTLLLMALWRIKRPEGLKENDPQALGRVLGLDRVPEVKTIRRKLTRIAGQHRAEQFGRELARVRVELRGELMGFLYVDGHVRAYHGKRDIPKTHVARIRLSMPATTDYWVNDRGGDPLFVMTAPANAGMVKMLPGILDEIRRLVGEDRRVTIVFDRGGWSPRLFKKLVDAGFDILTYRKGKCRRIGTHRFVLRRARIDGKAVEYELHDQAVRFLSGKLRLRQVTRLSPDGHQTPVVTSRWDLPDIEVAYRMFERWRQENFFKYLREEFLLDALVDYQVEPDDPTRTVPNPERRKMDKEVRAARAEVAKLEQAYGAAAMDNPEGYRPTMRGFKIAHGRIGKELRAARSRLAGLLERRRGIPVRIEVRDRSPEAVVRLATERKHLTNIVKMVAYQTESDLLALLRPHYARAEEEGRTLLHELFRGVADIAIADGVLRVTLGPLSAPHRTAAIETVSEVLTRTETLFPGSNLRMHFAVHPAREGTMAFPGPRSKGDAPPAPPRSDG
jgi:transposase